MRCPEVDVWELVRGIAIGDECTRVCPHSFEQQAIIPTVLTV